MPQPTDPIADGLEGVSGDLDALIARRRLGPRTAASLHDDEETAGELAALLLALFRKPTSKNPPLRVTGRGGWW